MTISVNSFSTNTKIESAKVNQNFTNIINAIRPCFLFPLDTILITGTNLTTVHIIPKELTIEKIYAVVKTASVGSDIIIDINKNGTSIWASNPDNRLTIPEGSTAVTTQTSFDTTSLSEEDILTLDIDQVGSTTPGEALTVLIKCN